MVMSSREGRENFGVSLEQRSFMVLISTISDPLDAVLHFVNALALGGRWGGDWRRRPSFKSLCTKATSGGSLE